MLYVLDTRLAEDYYITLSFGGVGVQAPTKQIFSASDFAERVGLCAGIGAITPIPFRREPSTGRMIVFGASRASPALDPTAYTNAFAAACFAIGHDEALFDTEFFSVQDYDALVGMAIALDAPVSLRRIMEAGTGVARESRAGHLEYTHVAPESRAEHLEYTHVYYRFPTPSDVDVTRSVEGQCVRHNAQRCLRQFILPGIANRAQHARADPHGRNVILEMLYEAVNQAAPALLKLIIDHYRAPQLLLLNRTRWAPIGPPPLHLALGSMPCVEYMLDACLPVPALSLKLINSPFMIRVLEEKDPALLARVLDKLSRSDDGGVFARSILATSSARKTNLLMYAITIDFAGAVVPLFDLAISFVEVHEQPLLEDVFVAYFKNVAPRALECFEQLLRLTPPAFDWGRLYDALSRAINARDHVTAPDEDAYIEMFGRIRDEAPNPAVPYIPWTLKEPIRLSAPAPAPPARFDYPAALRRSEAARRAAEARLAGKRGCKRKRGRSDSESELSPSSDDRGR